MGQPDGPEGAMWKPRNSALEIDYPRLDTSEGEKKDLSVGKQAESSFEQLAETQQSLRHIEDD